MTERMKSSRIVFMMLVGLVISVILPPTDSFAIDNVLTPSRSFSSDILQLNAKKQPTKSKSKGGTSTSTSTNSGIGGFGGGAFLEPCPCGSSETYSRCCGKIHKDINAYKSAKAEQIARARYSAYAKKVPDFLMATTHPLHKDFNTNLKQWKEQIK